MGATNNKYSFNELIKKLYALKFSLNKNRKKTYVLCAIIGSMIFSGYKFGEICNDLVDVIEYYYVIGKSNKEQNDRNSDAIKELLKDTILVAETNSDIEQDYYFNDGYLYDKNGNLFSLDGEERSISFFSCNIDNDVLDNIDLVKSKTKSLSLDYSNVDDGCIDYFPSTLEELSLRKCLYITNLNGVGDRCPNIKSINLDNAISLSDLSFVYELSNLEEIYLNGCPYITSEFLEYLNDNNIISNLSEADVINSKKIDSIIEEIISIDMSDEEKVRAVCLYVLDNMEYDVASIVESNNNPIECFLKKGKGVCASYAYLTNVLLNKAGVCSYVAVNENHGWNLIKLDGEYYYVDTTNMDGSLFNKMLLSIFNISCDYMVNPKSTDLNAMSGISDDETMIATSIVYDIVVNNKNNIDIFEKYGNMMLCGLSSIGEILSGALLGLILVKLKSLVNVTKDIYYDILFDYINKLNSFDDGNKNEINRRLITKVRKQK